MVEQYIDEMQNIGEMQNIDELNNKNYATQLHNHDILTNHKSV